MPNVLRIAVVDPKDSTREELKSMLLGLDAAWLEAECSRYEFFGDVVAQTNPDVGFVALDSNPAKGLELVTSLAKSAPQCDLLVTSTSTDGNLILSTMRRRKRVPYPAAQSGRSGGRVATRRQTTRRQLG